MNDTNYLNCLNHRQSVNVVSSLKHRPRVAAVWTIGDTGFTLIELMGVLAIMAVLAAIALPSYQYAVCKVKRAEGRSALMNLMQQQEQVYTQRMRYVEFSATSSDPDQRQFKWFSGDTASSSAYEIGADACPGMRIAECVMLSARPGTARVSTRYVDRQCGTLRLDSFGHRSADGEGCW
jgi:type IV pilus assembly protein PilE